MEKTESESVARVCEVLQGLREESTPVSASGLPGIYQSARMPEPGDFSLEITVSRMPTPWEFSAFAWHFADFAKTRGLTYEVVFQSSEVYDLRKRLSTGDTLSVYSVMTRRTGDGAKVNILKGHGSDNILKEYLAAIATKESGTAKGSD
jgi:hypothetical protein